VALSDVDRNLLGRCLARKPRAWEDFVDRLMGLVVHVVNHSSTSRGMRLSNEDREDLVALVFIALLKDDMAVLRRFRGESSLATYLTVVARRVVVAELLKLAGTGRTEGQHHEIDDLADPHDSEQRLSDREEIDRLLEELNEVEATVVRMYHLDGKSYQEISEEAHLPINSIGPTLSRARRKMRQSTVEPARDEH
jgi:RNA polymerase sigma-70 factor (ECF subfamily)